MAAALAEGIRGAVANLRFSLLRAVVAILLGASATFFILSDAADIEAQLEQDVSKGQYIYAIDGGEGGEQLSVQQCVALESVPGVVAAGAVVSEWAVSAVQSPQATYQLTGATPGYIAITWPQDGRSLLRADGLIVGPSMAADLGLNAGAAVDLQRNEAAAGRFVVAGAPGESVRIDSANRRAYFVSAPMGLTDECLVEAAPARYGDLSSLLSAWFSNASTIRVAPLLVGQEGNLAGPQWESRYSQYAWMLSAAVLLGFTALAWYAARADTALYMLLGVSRFRLAIIWSSDLACLTIFPYVLSAGITLAIRSSIASELSLRQILWQGLCVILVVNALPFAATLLMRRGSVVQALKGR